MSKIDVLKEIMEHIEVDNKYNAEKLWKNFVHSLTM